MKQKTLYSLIIGLLVLVIVIMSLSVSLSLSEPSAESKIVIEACNISIDDVGVDKLYFGIKVLLKNEGSTFANIDKIVLSLGKSKIESTFLSSLLAGKEKEYSLSYSPLEKKIGIDEVKGTISVIGSGKILAEKRITIQIPIARIGDTIPNVGVDIDKHNLSLIPLSWKKSNIAVKGPYFEGEYYTFTAKPGRKFVILIYKFQNNWIRPQETPTPSADKICEIVTDRGYIYPIWNLFGIEEYKAYKSRIATNEEVDILVGDFGDCKNLLPEESVKGCAVFEIPEDQTAIEASIPYVSPLIRNS